MTFFEEAIISGFIGEAIGRCTDVSWKKIKEVVKNRKNKHQNIESQIYNVIVNVLNQITYNKYENDRDKIYQAAERLLIGYKDSGCDNIEVVKSGMQILGESINSDKYMEFKTQLYQEISKSDYKELYHQIRLLQQDEESSKTSRIEEKVDKVQQSVDETNRRLNAYQESSRVVGNLQNKETVKSRTQEYADKWNENMFLNNFDEWDENAGVNVKLSDVYTNEHLPHFIWGNNKDESEKLDVLLSQYITKSNDNKMLVVLGQPGIGKSTLITWITVNFADRINDILVYRFASNLGNTDWNNGRISNRVLEELGLNHSDLNGKILILDGFDEVSIEANRRKDILDNLYIDWINNKTIENFSLIITCREHYVPQFAILKCKYITLQPWDEIQIRSFCSIFKEKTKYDISENTIEKLLENKEILGIPLILYMVLALNISIEKEGSIVDVYDKIFSLEGGIYDRCIDNKMFADKHRIGEIKKQIHQVSRDIAIWMFENNPEGASISQKEYEDICDGVMCQLATKDVEISHDFEIGSYFKKIRHCEEIEITEISFVHRSIYEYFVVETICNSIENAMIELSENSQKELAANIVIYLKEGQLTNIIKDYLQHKILKIYDRLNNEKKARFYLWWEEAINKMMNYGMFYYTSGNVQDYIDIISKETQCFINLMEILRVLTVTGKQEYIMENADKKQLEKYIRLSLMLSPEKMVSLNKMYLANLNLSGVNLISTDSRKVCFCNTDLQRANLHGLSLRGANLRGANLKDANLEGAVIDRCQVEYLERKYNLQGVNIYYERSDEIITYDELCEGVK